MGKTRLQRIYAAIERWTPTRLGIIENRWIGFHFMRDGAAAAGVRAVVGPGVHVMWIVVLSAAVYEAVELWRDGIPDCPEPGEEVKWWAWDTAGDLFSAVFQATLGAFL